MTSKIKYKNGHDTLYRVKFSMNMFMLILLILLQLPGAQS
jgi:hypothetical protein